MPEGARLELFSPGPSSTLRLDFNDPDRFTFERGAPDYPANVFEANLLFCDDRGDYDTGGGRAAGRWINIGGAGRPRIYAKRADVQGALGGC